MRRRRHPRMSWLGRLWSSRVWPVLAGGVMAVGVLAAYEAFGLVPFLIVYAALALFGVVTVWGLSLEEFDLGLAAVVRIGLGAALVVVALAGLCQILPRHGLLIAVILGITSPMVMNLLARVRTRSASRTVGPGPRFLVDQGMLDRRFDDIVVRLNLPDGAKQPRRRRPARGAQS